MKVARAQSVKGRVRCGWALGSPSSMPQENPASTDMAPERPPNLQRRFGGAIHLGRSQPRELARGSVSSSTAGAPRLLAPTTALGAPDLRLQEVVQARRWHSAHLNLSSPLVGPERLASSAPGCLQPLLPQVARLLFKVRFGGGIRRNLTSRARSQVRPERLASPAAPDPLRSART